MKSKISTHLFTNGDEFINSITQENYIGWYNIDAEGKIFSEKVLNVEKSFILLPKEMKTTLYEKNVNNEISKIKMQKEAKSYYPIVKQIDIDNKYINRYFVKKNNVEMLLLKEIDEETYRSIKNQEGIYYDSLYTTYEIQWWIGLSKIECVNRNKEALNKNPILVNILNVLDELYIEK